ncbi:hypothetical protein [Saccharopolyspora phatthalungensis]|uniref:Uncharacterized protein n=1 Tax=Saccharopolyspora phatthalungensis TaxID=664693 RepID=A0A840QCZ5_9PSEU|nr:hypothetical protein [Saccharopolyspora phatthalungensis]MBB5158266.1 hypothetical protein [Saccharopolyspora phatthalungensis]
MVAHALLHGAYVVAGREVPVGELVAAARAGPLHELLLLGQRAISDRVL